MTDKKGACFVPTEVTVMPGAFVAEGVVVRPHVFIGPNAVVLAAADPLGPQTTLQAGCVIGANATVLPAVEVGQRANVSPGSVVTQSVPPLAIVEGNPARIVGYVESASSSGAPLVGAISQEVRSTMVRGVTLHQFRTVVDIRGSLSAG